MRTQASIFKNRTSFYQELWDESKKNMKSQKNYWPWGLGPRNYIWVTRVQKMYPVISPESWLQFSQTRPHFLKNHEMNPIKPWNYKTFLDLGAWDLETTLGPLGSRRRIKPLIQNSRFNFQISGPHFFKNHEMNSIKSCYLKKFISIGTWGLETTFGPLGPRRRMEP